MVLLKKGSQVRWTRCSQVTWTITQALKARDPSLHLLLLMSMLGLK